MNLNTLRFSTAKAIRTLGLFGIMMALAGLLATGVRPASASSIGPGGAYGKVSVAAIFSDNTSSLIAANVDIRNTQGVVVAKGIATNGSNYATSLTVGSYKVHVTAAGYKDYGAVINVTKGATTAVKATLTSLTDPFSVITPSSTITPAPAPVIDPVPVPVQLGKLNVSVQFAPTAATLSEVGVLVSDSIGNVVAKGTATTSTNFASQLAPGTYKVYVMAQGYNEFSQIVKVGAGQTTFVKAYLTPANQ